MKKYYNKISILLIGFCAGIMFTKIAVYRSNFVITGHQVADYWIQNIIIVILLLSYLVISKRIQEQAEAAKPACNHNNWGPVHEGFQYCRDCGATQAVEHPRCHQHKWEVLEKIEIPSKEPGKTCHPDGVSEIVFINRCENCGIINPVGVDCSGKK